MSGGDDFQLETERLVLRELTLEDASFLFTLVNDPAWRRFIGDAGVETLDEARLYAWRGPISSYRLHGFGLWAVEFRGVPGPIGICGPIRREGLKDADLGFAFLPEHRGHGYATESAAAVLDHARRELGFARVVAMTSPDNADSIHVLDKLGFRFESTIRLRPQAEELNLYAWGVPREEPAGG